VFASKIDLLKLKFVAFYPIIDFYFLGTQLIYKINSIIVTAEPSFNFGRAKIDSKRLELILICLDVFK